MRRTLTIISLFIVTTVNAQNNQYREIIVKSQMETIRLYKADVEYILTKTKNKCVHGAINGSIQTIRNNDVADMIIAIIKNRKP